MATKKTASKAVAAVSRKPGSSRLPKDLRARAEESLAKTRRDIPRMPVQDVQKLVHELQVHQIELEMQNDELRRTQLGLEEASDRYSDLYDFAPSALLTLSERGEVLEANLTTSDLLGLERKRLLKQNLARFIPAEAQDAFYLYCRQVLQSGTKQIGELTLKSATGRELTVRLEGIAAQDPKTQKTQCRLSLNDITAAKQSEAVLRRYELLAGHSRDIFLFIRRDDGRVLEANAAATAAYGYRREELLALTICDLRADGMQAQMAEQMAQADAGGILFETIHKRSDGSTFPVEVSSRCANMGETRTLISVVRDITLRKKAEAALVTVNARLDGIISSAMDAMISVDARQHIVLFNQAAEKMFGIRAQEALGQSLGRFIPERYRAAHVRHVSQFGETGVSSRSMGRLGALLGLRASGEEFPIEASISQVEVKGEKLFTVVLRDATERKQAEEALQDMALFPHENTWPVLRVTRDGKLLYANPAADSLLAHWQCSPGGTVPEVVHQAVTAVLQSGVSQELELSHVGRDLSFALTPLGGRNYVNLYGSDVTERKQAQRALQLMADELERSNCDLEQFANVASHDLQEPLRAVRGFVRLLQQRFPDQVDAKATEYITGACDGAERMERLIDGLLAYSRVGTQGGDFVPVDLNALLGDALRNLQASLKAAQAHVTHNSLPSLPADATQITQLFQNLIGNAIKFRGEQPPQIHVGVRREPDRWVFSVRDTGIGIEPQYFERIFQLFQRLHSPKHYPGTGIGLAVCKRIVERHGGTIWVESQPGQGSTFFFSIPEAVTR